LAWPNFLHCAAAPLSWFSQISQSQLQTLSRQQVIAAF
jgi:hypothetical protein